MPVCNTVHTIQTSYRLVISVFHWTRCACILLKHHANCSAPLWPILFPLPLCIVWTLLGFVMKAYLFCCGFFRCACDLLFACVCDGQPIPGANANFTDNCGAHLLIRSRIGWIFVVFISWSNWTETEQPNRERNTLGTGHAAAQQQAAEEKHSQKLGVGCKMWRNQSKKWSESQP